MPELDMAATMDAIAQRLLDGETTTRAYAWPVESIAAPCAVVGYPTGIDFDATFQRGSDKAVFPVWFIVGKGTDKSARDALSSVITGARGIKDVLDGNLGGAVQTARVTDCTIDTVTVGAVSFLAARFDLEVYS